CPLQPPLTNAAHTHCTACTHSTLATPPQPPTPPPMLLPRSHPAIQSKPSTLDPLQCLTPTPQHPPLLTRLLSTSAPKCYTCRSLLRSLAPFPQTSTSPVMPKTTFNSPLSEVPLSRSA